MKPIDRLYMWSLILTLIATCLLYTGMLLPNWWIQKDSRGITTRIIGLFGSIHCASNVCYPADQIPVSLVDQTLSQIPDQTGGSRSTAMDPMRARETSSQNTGSSSSSLSTFASGSTPPGLPADPLSLELPANAGWLIAGRVFGGISMVLVMITLLLQMAFMLFPHRRFEMVSFGFLVASALVSFITGFILISKFSALSKEYITKRPPGALTYTSAAPGCILISSLLCVVAAVFTILAFRTPKDSLSSSRKINREKNTSPNVHTPSGDTAGTGDEDQLLA